MEVPPFLAITGLKHVGKSTIARMVASRLGVRWIDTDDELLRTVDITRNNHNEPPIRAAYRALGRKKFQERETFVLRQIIHSSQTEKNDGTGTVVLSTGGGICDNPEAFGILQEHTYILFLDEQIDTLFHRIMKHGVPAYLDATRPYEHFAELSEKRRTKYHKAAHYTLHVTNTTITDIVDEILSLLR